MDHSLITTAHGNPSHFVFGLNMGCNKRCGVAASLPDYLHALVVMTFVFLLVLYLLSSAAAAGMPVVME